MGDKLAINWRFFSLEQVNSKEGPEWKLWEQPPDYASRGRNAFRAAGAARKQGQAAFEGFHFALLKARHEERQDISDIAVLLEVAEKAGLDRDRLREDMDDPGLLTALAEDHTNAVDNLNVFGTPTLVFADGQSVFVKMMPPSSDEEAVKVFEEIRQMAVGRPEIRELKRPQ